LRKGKKRIRTHRQGPKTKKGEKKKFSKGGRGPAFVSSEGIRELGKSKSRCRWKRKAAISRLKIEKRKRYPKKKRKNEGKKILGNVIIGDSKKEIWRQKKGAARFREEP